MATLRFEGVDEYIAELNKLGGATEEIVGKTIYHGAKVVADAIKANIRALPVTQGVYGDDNHKLNGITAAQKTGLINGFGISPMRKTGTQSDVKIGFDGYNRTFTKRFPTGQPNVMVARSIEGGTSFRQKHPFVAPAVRATKGQAEQIMKETLEKEIRNITGG